MHTLDDLKNQLREFARERDWEQFHSPKNVAMAIVPLKHLENFRKVLKQIIP